MNEVNPYATPTTVEDISVAPQEYQPPNLVVTFLKWFLICMVSAAPSFYLGMMGRDTIRVPAMLTGIMIFVFAYTYVDMRYMRPKSFANRALRTTFRIGYGTRITASILFLPGMFMDMWLGLISVGIVAAIPGLSDVTASRHDFGETSAVRSFVSVLLTTLIQGTLLNIVLGVYMLVVHQIVKRVQHRNNDRTLANRAELGAKPPIATNPQVVTQNQYADDGGTDASR